MAAHQEGRAEREGEAVKRRGILTDGAKPSTEMLNLVREWSVALQHPPCGRLWTNRILSSFQVYGLGGCARRQYRAKLYFAGMLVLREVTPLSNSNPFLEMIPKRRGRSR